MKAEIFILGGVAGLFSGGIAGAFLFVGLLFVVKVILEIFIDEDGNSRS